MEEIAEITYVVKNEPSLRFPEFNEAWVIKRLGEITKRVSDPVLVEKQKLYQQIGIKSHGKGLFYKDPVDGHSLGNKRVFWVKENTLVVNIVFAWEQAVAKTTINEIGMIASHRFPMFVPAKNQSDVDYLVYYFLTKKGKFLLELASPGGAGRNKTLGQKEFENLKFLVPSLLEQKKIASFLSLVDFKIQQINKKKELLEKYKEGVKQKIFSQQIKFKDVYGNEFTKWEEKNLEEVLIEHKTRNIDLAINEVFSVAKEKGVVNQIEHLGRSYASDDISNYKVVYPNDVIYTKSPTSNFPYGIIKQNKLDRTGVVSVLYAVFKPVNKNIGLLLDYCFSSWTNTYNYLNPLVQKGAKNTININNTEFLKGRKISLPSSPEEQQKIVDFLISIDNKLNHTTKQLEQAKKFKKGLLQQLFV